MEHFDVLNHTLDIHKSRLLEASAGTGKTFSIENLYVRFLIEQKDASQQSPRIDEILAVTFTRAATAELKMRIRANIEKALIALKLEDQNSPDYLLYIIQNSKQAIIDAKHKLERALACFEEAHIYTIHGFCAKFLNEHAFEGDLSMPSHLDDHSCTSQVSIELVKDFFRCGNNDRSYCPAQFSMLFKNKDFHDVAQIISKWLQTGLQIDTGPNFDQSYKAFAIALGKLNQEYNPSLTSLQDYLSSIASNYNQTHNKEGVIRPEIQKGIDLLCDCLAKGDLSTENFNLLLSVELFNKLSSESLKKRGKPTKPAQYPLLWEKIQEFLAPIAQQAMDESGIFARVVKDCIVLKASRQVAEEQSSPDDLLHAMHKNLEKPAFIEKIRNRFKVVIIDEFQDTDPLQWDIFSKCFLSKSCGTKTPYCYLVGDPKQSIYAFRRADIYTYLSAANALGEHAWAYLDINYRSQRNLVAALNEIFSSARSTGWMSLPKTNSFLPYEPVKPSLKALDKKIKDSKGSIHFILAQGLSPERSDRGPSIEIEEALLFPYIANELIRLRRDHQIQLHQCAILVKDRYQSSRIKNYLLGMGIPVNSERTASIIGGDVHKAMDDVLQAVFNPLKTSFLRKSLAGKIFFWTHDEIECLNQEPDLEHRICDHFIFLQSVLYDQGVPAFFEALLNQPLIEGQEVPLIQILGRSDGPSFYHELQAFLEIALEETQSHSLQEWLSLLKSADPTDEKYRIPPEECHDGVRLMTLHASKGLEFDIVFPLGLINRTPQTPELVPSILNENQLVPFNNNAPESIQFANELDAEKMRQLYVALTRAKERLYLPVLILGQEKPPRLGTGSPMEIFLGKMIVDHDSLFSLLRTWSCNADITFELLEEAIVAEITRPEICSQDQMTAPPLITIPGTEKTLSSFSNIAQFLSSKHFIETKRYTCETGEKSIHTLPPGTETGSLVHSLMQLIPLELMKSDINGLYPFIAQSLQSTHLESWEKIVTRMLYDVFNIPLSGGPDTFCLKDVNPSQIVREMEFLMPGNFACEEITLKNHVMTGFIDCFFSYRDRIYLIDWKTNWLGTCMDDYNDKNIENAMQMHHYYLQARVYTQAIMKYFRLYHSGSLENLFGGAFYLFMRGIQNPCAVKFIHPQVLIH